MPAHDIIVIGGGIIGGSIAWELARRGAHPLILERETQSQEASWAAAGMLQPAPESAEMIPLVPLGRASLALYPQFAADIEEDSRRKVNLRRHGALELMFSADAERELSTLIALHHGLGLSAEPLPVEEALALEPALNPNVRAAMLMPDEAAVDNRALAAAAIEAAWNRGAEFAVAWKSSRWRFAEAESRAWLRARERATPRRRWPHASLHLPVTTNRSRPRPVTPDPSGTVRPPLNQCDSTASKIGSLCVFGETLYGRHDHIAVSGTRPLTQGRGVCPPEH